MFIKLFSFCKQKIEFFRPNQMSKSSWCHIWMSRYFKICTVFQFSSPLYGRFFFYKSTWRWQMWKTKKWVVLYSTINNVFLATEYIRCSCTAKGKKWRLQLNTSGQISHDIFGSYDTLFIILTSDLGRKIQFCTNRIRTIVWKFIYWQA